MFEKKRLVTVMSFNISVKEQLIDSAVYANNALLISELVQGFHWPVKYIIEVFQTWKTIKEKIRVWWD